MALVALRRSSAGFADMSGQARGDLAAGKGAQNTGACRGKLDHWIQPTSPRSRTSPRKERFSDRRRGSSTRFTRIPMHCECPPLRGGRFPEFPPKASDSHCWPSSAIHRQITFAS